MTLTLYLLITLILFCFSFTIQLPLYGNPYPPQDIIQSQEMGQLEGLIYSSRQFVLSNLPFLQGLGQRTRSFVETGFSHTQSAYDYLKEEDKMLPKVLAVTSGGFLGLILASRKGFFKKTLYTGAGLGAFAAVLFPQQTQETVQLGAYIAKNKAPEALKEFLGIDISSWTKSETSNVHKNDNQSEILEKLTQASSDIQQYGFKIK